MFEFTCSKCGKTEEMDKIKEGWTREIPTDKRMTDHLFNSLAVFTCNTCNNEIKLKEFHKKHGIMTAKELSEMEFEQNIEIDEDGDILIFPHKSNEYWIEKDRCDTYPKIVSWVEHLSGKQWITGELINEFVVKACHNAGLNPYTDC